MKIWILSSETPHYAAGGIARYVDHFARALGQRGHCVRVVARGHNPGLREVAPNYWLHEFSDRHKLALQPQSVSQPDDHTGWPYNNMAYFAALSYQFAEVLQAMVAEFGPPEVIESQEYAAIAYFLQQRKLLGEPTFADIPVVINLHTPDFLVQEWNQAPRFKLPAYWIGRMELASIWMADAVISPSAFIAREVAARLEGEAPPVEVFPLPHGDFPAATGNGGELDRPRLVMPGRVELRKGIEPLLRACDELWRGGLDFELHVIGGDVETAVRGGSLVRYLTDRYMVHLQSGRLVFHGSLNYDECLKWVCGATAVVIPSLKENFPNTCMEAMGMGKLVLASDSGGHVEMLGNDGRAGVLFSHERRGDLRRGILRVLEMSDSERMQLGSCAAERIRQLCCPQRVVDLRIQHFERVVREHRPKRRFPFTNARLRDGPLADELASQPLLSVVVPFYNLGAYLDECLESILAADYPALEVIIVDDGSFEPDSLAALARWEDRGLGNLRVLHIGNAGLANARNVGAEAARGPCIAFVDADDAVGPTFFSKAIRLLQRFPNVHYVYAWTRFFDEGTGVWHSWNTDLPYLLAHNQLIPLVVVRRDSFLRHGRNKPHIVYGLEDYEGWISMAEAGCGGIAIPEPLNRYRVRRQSMFRQLLRDKMLYLYGLIAAEHPQLYGEYAVELFQLLNANGPAHIWDLPTAFRSPFDKIYQQWQTAAHDLEHLRDENRRLKEAEAWHKQQRKIYLGEKADVV